MVRKKSKLLSVVIPVFNEEKTIIQVIDKVVKCGVKELEIIVVDDGSTDKTRQQLRNNPHITVLITNPTNKGKGEAVKKGLAAATAEIVVIQDADLEYDPCEIPKLIKPIIEKRADVVYGTRFVGGEPHRVVYYWHYIGNVVLTTLSNIFTNLNLTDMETGYKAFRREFIQAITIEESSFAIEPEITAKLAAQKARFYEVGITYHGRTYEEGKKISVKDFFTALRAIIQYGLFKSAKI